MEIIDSLKSIVRKDDSEIKTKVLFKQWLYNNVNNDMSIYNQIVNRLDNLDKNFGRWMKQSLFKITTSQELEVYLSKIQTSPRFLKMNRIANNEYLIALYYYFDYFDAQNKESKVNEKIELNQSNHKKEMISDLQNGSSKKNKVVETSEIIVKQKKEEKQSGVLGDAFEDAYEKSAQRFITLQNNYQEIQRQLTEVYREYNAAKEKINRIADEKLILEEKLQVITEKYTNADLKITTLSEENRKLREDNEELKEKAGELRVKLASNKRGYVSDLTEIRDNIKQYKKILTDKDKEIESLKQKLDISTNVKEKQKGIQVKSIKEENTTKVVKETKSNITKKNEPLLNEDISRQNTGSKTKDKIYPSISVVFAQPKFRPLVIALNNHGYYKVNQLQQIKLLRFCNEYNIYDYPIRTQMVEEANLCIKKSLEEENKESEISSNIPEVVEEKNEDKDRNPQPQIKKEIIKENKAHYQIKDSELTKNMLHKVAVKLNDPLSFRNKTPVSFKLLGQYKDVKTWQEVLNGVAEILLDEKPECFLKIVDKPISPQNTLVVIKRKPYNKSAYEPLMYYWIRKIHSPETVIKVCYMLLDVCKASSDQLTIYTTNYSPNGLAIEEENKIIVQSGLEKGKSIRSNKESYTYANKVFKKAESTGITQKKSDLTSQTIMSQIPKIAEEVRKQPTLADEVYKYLADCELRAKDSMSIARALESKKIRCDLRNIQNILETDKRFLPFGIRKYINFDSLSDKEEAADALEEIIEQHFKKYHGYTNKMLVFHSFKINQSMFMNDNLMEKEDDIWRLCIYLFEKIHYHGKSYCFNVNRDCWEKVPGLYRGNIGVLINFCRSNGGIMSKDEATQYLKSIHIETPISAILNIRNNDTFLQYEPDKFIEYDPDYFDDKWLSAFSTQCQSLLGDANFVILRLISSAFYDLLPRLPQGLKWTAFMFQDIIDNFNKVPFKLIPPGDSARYTCVFSAYVPEDSGIKSIRELTLVQLHQEGVDQKTFTPGELKEYLVEHQLIETTHLSTNSQIIKSFCGHGCHWRADNSAVTVRC